MTIRVQLFQGEKDGQEFKSPWPPGKHPSIFRATTNAADEEIAALGSEIPAGFKTRMSTLAYSFVKKVDREDGESYTELQYYRTPELDERPRPKPVPRPRTKKQGP